ncbi:MAG: YihY/virulence factor BrkB family protein [Actinomycetota bacterium]
MAMDGVWHRVSDRAPTVVDLVRRAVEQFLEDRAKRLSAGLAYYTLFALVPTLLLTVAIAAAFVGKEAAAGELEQQMTSWLGANAAEQIQQAIGAMWESGQRSNFALFSAGVVVFSTTILFVAWRDVLEVIWEVPYQSGLRTSLLNRATGVLVPVAAGLLLATTLLLQTGVTFVQQLVRTGVLDVALRVAGALAQGVLGVGALAVMYRYSVRTGRPTWREVLPASLFVAVVLAIGLWGYGVYLRTIGVSSVTGAASSVVLGLVVIYYMAQALLFAAELIKVGRQRSPGEPVS